MNFKTEEQFKKEIEVICNDLFFAGLTCNEFNKKLTVIWNWIICEWHLGHIDMHDINMFKSYAMKTALNNWHF